MALVKCKECGFKVSTKAAACPQCGAKINKAIGCGTLIVVLCIAFFIVSVMLRSADQSDESQSVSTEAPSKSTSLGSPSVVVSPPANSQPAASPIISRQADIAVQNLIVKRVPVGNSTRFRYFFTTKNNGSSPFVGNVNIRLHTRTTGITNADFKCGILPGIQGVNYIDARTGPERFHADSAYVEFSYRATVDSAVVAEGRGTITTKFEDLSQ
jgi:hypothetical protein